jgi:UDP-N-acetyl-D-galactosamine dehydrogenase
VKGRDTLGIGLYEKIVNKQEKISVIGLGYVGLPLAVAFARKANVIGYDVNEKKINLYKKSIDPTNEVGSEAIKQTTVEFTSDETRLREAKFHIVAVPTPINLDKTPDLTPVESASATVGRNLTEGSIVVYESTVYPGVTEDICIPILEKESGLKCGTDFKVGYSPERINPGDKIHRLETIVKIVSGIDEESLDEIAKVYELIIQAGVHKVSSIKVAEAAKVVENSQRDINIAFMNELAMVFDRMGIDSKEVIEAMNTKWNALGFYPGLVGGHCIGVDPYYFIYQAEKLGYHSQIILAGRKINDGMGEFVADAIIKKLVLANKVVKKAKIVIFGITFKENCPDTRNSKVIDIIKRLKEYGIEPVVVDPVANKDDAKEEYGIDLAGMGDIKDADCLVFAVAHNEFKDMSLDQIDALFGNSKNNEKIIIDVKSIFDKKTIEKQGYSYWRL